MRFTLLLGISAAVSALPLDGSDKSLLSDSASTGPKLPLYRVVDYSTPKLPLYRVFDENHQNQVRTEAGEILERSPLTGPKLPLYRIVDENHQNQVRTEAGEVLERSPLPEADKVAVNAAN
ncbi:hypothetical protein E4U30_005852 [Claviceps sp. LM220 group G6]|nr:hypothetical protein E4U30_005852 [Claviceps sp. LM220 group G6]KAG6103201.1 hypothetical protein E4U31_002973 [Claviceps sp. LM219 group G6]